MTETEQKIKAAWKAIKDEPWLLDNGCQKDDDLIEAMDELIEDLDS